MPTRQRQVSLPKICSRFRIPKIAAVDAKTGKVLIGYARVSTADQDLALQTDALAKAGCEAFYRQGKRGKDRSAGLAEALHFARAGGCIMAWKLNRLGRLSQGLISLAADLIELCLLIDSLDTATTSGRLLFLTWCNGPPKEN